jgi:hypothetical protein
MRLRASIGLKTKTDLTYKGLKAKKSRRFFCHWLEVEIGGGKLDKTLAEAECLAQDSGPKKNAPAEGRFLGRPMGKNQGLLFELLMIGF